MFQNYKLPKFFQTSPDVYPENDPLDLDAVKALHPVIKLISRYFRPTYIGLEHIPKQGPALLVGNHGIIGFDAAFIFMAIFEATGRMPRGIGDYHLFLDPISRKFWTSLGAFSGTRENAERFLKAGHLVNVYPGGARDAWKGSEGRYQLHWDKSFGFIEVAMKTGAPIILHMGIGIDDTYQILGKIRVLGKIFGHPKYELPVLLGMGFLPLPVKFTYYISKMLYLDGGPDDIHDRNLVQKNHRKVWNLAKKMIREGLKKRHSLWFG